MKNIDRPALAVIVTIWMTFLVVLLASIF